MPTASMKRSQAILRMPVDMIDAVMFLCDGDRADVLLIIPPSEDIARFVTEGGRFVPVVRQANTVLVARTALVALGVAKRFAPRTDAELPSETQKVAVKLVGGAQLEGTMTWVGSTPDQRRCGAYLNAEPPYFVLHAGDTVYLVMKDGALTVTEL